MDGNNLLKVAATRGGHFTFFRLFADRRKSSEADPSGDILAQTFFSKYPHTVAVAVSRTDKYGGHLAFTYNTAFRSLWLIFYVNVLRCVNYDSRVVPPLNHDESCDLKNEA